MNDENVSNERMRYVCRSCSKSLFGIVKYCPFCGERQVDRVVSDDTSAKAQQDSGTRPLTPSGQWTEVVRPPQTPPGARVLKTSTLPSLAADAGLISAFHPGTTPPKAASLSAAPMPSPSVGAPAQAVISTAPDAATRVEKAGDQATNRFKWIALLLVAGVGYTGWDYLRKPTELDLCRQTLENAVSSMQANQFAQARTLALSAVARCTGDSHERAKSVLKATESAQRIDDNCSKAIRLTDSQISEGQLKLALRTLDTQPEVCLSREDATSRKQQIDNLRASAAEKISQALIKASDGQFDEARASVSEAERLDRENADLGKTRREIDAKMREIAKVSTPPVSSAPVSSVPVAPPTLSPVVPAPSPVTVPTPVAPAVQQADNVESNMRLECAVLVRAGTRALTNRSYDEAMQSAQEARTVFAGCPGALELLQSARQAKDRARQSVTIQ